MQAAPFPYVDAELVQLERPQPDRVLERLQRGAVLDRPTTVIAAHPDDETLGMGGRLPLFTRLTLVQLTDGAPQSPDRKRSDAAERRRIRAAELGQALAILGITPRWLHVNLRDQDVVLALVQTVRALRVLLRGAEVVITHAYEGGHPDHDAAAFAVQAACRLIAREGGRPPLRLEFAGYHAARGKRVTGAFWPDPDHPSVYAELSPVQLDRKRAALLCFRSQADVVAWFAAEQEAYRHAPDYAFTKPPPPGEALYDRWGLGLTSERWREHASVALRELGLAGLP